MDDFYEQMRLFRCPRWAELPEFPLYMDQVLALLEKRIALFELPQEGKTITSTMINNYVKQKLIPAPVQKKYEREQLARLYIICILKRCFSIGEIQTMMEYILRYRSMQQVYDVFCDCFEEGLRCMFGGADLPVILPVSEDERLLCGIYGVMLAVTSKIYAQRLVQSLDELDSDGSEKKDPRRDAKAAHGKKA